jgi:hypothetical protein
MSKQLTADDARQSLEAHLSAKGQEIRQKYGPQIGWNQLLQILQDRTCVRYPCEIVFDAAPLLEGELAHPVPKGERPEEGFTMHVHPFFASQPDRAPVLVLYQLVLVNYGDFASAEDAEIFGSTVLGLSRDDYYKSLCEMAGEIGGDAQSDCTQCG